MKLRLTTTSGSPRGWRVLLGMAFKGLAPELNLLKLSENEHKTEPFTTLNPRGTVPVLECEGVVLRDSIAILAWLDRKFPDTPLFGATEAQAAVVWQTAMECRQYLRQASADFLAPILFGDASLKDKGAAKWDTLVSAANGLHKEMQRLDTQLQDGRQFLAGENPSAADALAWPELRLIERASEREPDLMTALGFEETANLLCHLKTWKMRVADYPGVDKTMPAHWQVEM